MNIKLRYAHAVQDPWDNNIARPFEFREVEAELTTRMEDECIAVVTVNGRPFVGCLENDMRDAVEQALFEAEYALMDESRHAWKARNPVSV